MINHNELIFSDPNLADDFKKAFSPELGKLSPVDELIKAVDKAIYWIADYENQFPTQKEFIERPNMLGEFPVSDLLKAIQKTKATDIKSGVTADLKQIQGMVAERNELVKALQHIRDSFWSEGESYKERFEYLQEFAAETLKKKRESNERNNI